MLKWLGLSKREYRKKIFNGMYMLITPAEHIQQQLFWYGYYEKPVALLLEEFIKDDSTILDIGAHIGYFTLVAAQRAKNGKIYAFEPVTELFQKLQRNIDENGLLNAEALNYAVGDSEEDSLIHLSSPDNTGMSSLRPPENYSGISETIRLITIDGWINQEKIATVDIVKLDVEGCELLALRGMEKLLLNQKPVLIVEINAETLGYFNFSPKDVMDYLDHLGYLSFGISKNGFLQKIAEVNREGNIAFVHFEKLKEFNSH